MYTRYIVLWKVCLEGEDSTMSWARVVPDRPAKAKKVIALTSAGRSTPLPPSKSLKVNL